LTDKEADQVLRNRLKLRLKYYDSNGKRPKKKPQLTISVSNDNSVQFSLTNKGKANLYRVESIEELDKIILALQDIKEYLK
jgi:autonomous glycyl radical cofactor GrcA